MQSRDTILAPGLVTVEAQMQPALIVLDSYFLLAMAEARSGLDAWVYETTARLTPDQRHMTRLLYFGLNGIMTLERTRAWESFEQFLDAYAAADPADLMQRDVAIWCTHKKKAHGGALPDMKTLISDPEVYLAFTLDRDMEDYDYDRALIRETHRFLSDPVGMHARTVAHLHEMWEAYLRPEWQRREDFVRASVEAFTTLNTPPTTLVEAVRTFTGRDITSWMSESTYAQMERVIFVPSPHMGPYITTYDAHDPNITRMVFGARIPSTPVVEGLGTFEVHTRLEALADPVRLQIARLLAERGTVSTEEIMEAFDLSKSGASRQLRQLTATGLLLERREGGAKKVYSLNRDTALRLIRALEGMLLREG
jgi:DNA-binding transcriptional ArsR family regulator